jgi:hypothetical protein
MQTGSLKKIDQVICASIGAQFKASRKFRQYIRFIPWPHTQRGFRTLAASDDSFTTSISQQGLGFTQRCGHDPVPITLIGRVTHVTVGCAQTRRQEPSSYTYLQFFL